jgi:hypothetical protein
MPEAVELTDLPPAYAASPNHHGPTMSKSAGLGTDTITTGAALPPPLPPAIQPALQDFQSAPQPAPSSVASAIATATDMLYRLCVQVGRCILWAVIILATFTFGLTAASWAPEERGEPEPRNILAICVAIVALAGFLLSPARSDLRAVKTLAWAFVVGFLPIIVGFTIVLVMHWLIQVSGLLSTRKVVFFRGHRCRAHHRSGHVSE